MINALYPALAGQAALPFLLTGAGICDPEYDVKRDSGLISHQLLFTESGCGVVEVGGQTIRQSAGGLFYLPPGLAHRYRPENGEWRTCWVVFRGQELAEIMPRLGFSGFAAADGALTDEMSGIFRRLMAAAADPISGTEKCSLLVYEFVLAARRALFFPELRSSGPLQRVTEFIDAHFAEDITLAKLTEIWADARPVTAQHFCRVFKSAVGMRPMEYIARRRIARAKLLLWNTDDTAAEIGRQCGYPDPTYFGAVFRRYEGISPGEYRRRKGADII